MHYAVRTLLILLALLAMPALPAGAQVALVDSVPRLTTQGLAEAEVEPDLATLSVAAQTERPKAADAVAENTRVAQALVQEIRGFGIEPKDIRTISVTLAPVYTEERDPQGRVLRRVLKGYLARNGLEVRVRDMAKAGPLARALMDKGANQFGGIRFSLADEQPVRLQLKARAAAQALAKARAMAEPLGVRLGRVLAIGQEQDEVASPRRARMAAAAPMALEADAAAQAAIPVEPGVITLVENLSVTWELEPNTRP
jgi:hypothetical protein